MKNFLLCVALSAMTLSGAAKSPDIPVAAPQAEYLDRGLVAVPTAEGVFVSWRSLGRDGDGAAFDVYRDGMKANHKPITRATCFTDASGRGGCTYEVRVTSGDSKGETASCTAWDTPYKKIHLRRPEGGMADDREYTFSPDDISVGDVDGDGRYELFVKWMPSNGKDSAHDGFTGPTIIDCYRLDGTQLWRIDLGQNIRSGQHYTQFMVYDFDGDGSAEMICKTAPGTRDGKGNWVLMGNDDPKADYRAPENVGGYNGSKTKGRGHVVGPSPEYLTCFSGKTGEALSTIRYRPSYTDFSQREWGDNYGNRSDRYLACVACLDGRQPSAVMCRGYYHAGAVWAVDFRDGKLRERWLHTATKPGKDIWGEGAHAVTVGDVDGDGKDEIIYGAACLDHDGKLLYRTGGGHGDALHLAKMIPGREGLQVFMPHENTSAPFPFDTEMRDALTGEILFMNPQSGNDIGRGIAANVTPLFPGYEYWSTCDNKVYNQGTPVADRPRGLPINFRIYWDGDLLDECYDGTRVIKPLPDLSAVNTLVDFRTYGNLSSCNGSKSTPNLQADILGDWREEIILHDADTKSDLLIFTTTIPTPHRLPCLMEDHQYRMAIAWQNTCYNQPPHPGYSPEETYGATAPAIHVTAGSPVQTVKTGDPLVPTTFKVEGAMGLTPLNLPSWCSWSFDPYSLTGTLTGTPTRNGDYTLHFATIGAPEGTDITLPITVKSLGEQAWKQMQSRFERPRQRGNRQGATQRDRNQPRQRGDRREAASRQRDNRP